jgi:hypothetical protein
VRVDDEAVARAVIAELGDLLVPDDDPPPGYAVVTRPLADRPPARPLPQLRHGPVTVMRSRDPGRLALALANHVRSHDDRERSTVRIASAAVVTDAGAVLLPPEQLWLPGVERQLQAAGYSCIDTPIVEVDLETNQLIGRAWTGAPLNVGAVRSVITRWLMRVPDGDPVIHHPAGRVTVAARLVRWRSASDPQASLESVASITRSVAPESSSIDVDSLWRQLRLHQDAIL